MKIRNNDKELFKGRCPYTNKECKIWLCQYCLVEHRERRYMKKAYKEEKE